MLQVDEYEETELLHEMSEIIHDVMCYRWMRMRRQNYYVRWRRSDACHAAVCL